MAKLQLSLYLCILFFANCRPNTSEIQGADIQRPLDSLQYFSNKDLDEIKIGNLFLPSGEIVAGDPFFMHTRKPFSKTVAPGTYPVSIMVSKIGKKHYRIAFAKISFTSSQAVRWEMAFTTDITQEEIDSLGGGDYFGYGVDAGLGCFTDAKTNDLFSTAFIDWQTKNPDGNYYSDLLAAEFKKESGDHPFSNKDGSWCNHFPKGDKHNVIMFASGWGDGSYPSFWGYDSEGQLVELITDFRVSGPAGK